MKLPKAPPRLRGRPRSFNQDVALERAMTVFWKKGYEGASVDELAKAMKVTPPSLYAAFGNKESLFLRALERYAEGPGQFASKALKAPTARAVAEQFLYGTVEAMSNQDTPGGCLATHTAALLADPKTDIGRKILAICHGVHQSYRDRFERAKQEGDLSKNVDADELARYLYTVCQGISVQAAWGATREQLHLVVDRALKQWPK